MLQESLLFLHLNSISFSVVHSIVMAVSARNINLIVCIGIIWSMSTIDKPFQSPLDFVVSDGIIDPVFHWVLVVVQYLFGKSLQASYAQDIVYLPPTAISTYLIQFKDWAQQLNLNLYQIQYRHLALAKCLAQSWVKHLTMVSPKCYSPPLVQYYKLHGFILVCTFYKNLFFKKVLFRCKNNCTIIN